jgi:hypothetical protein
MSHAYRARVCDLNLTSPIRLSLNVNRRGGVQKRTGPTAAVGGMKSFLSVSSARPGKGSDSVNEVDAVTHRSKRNAYNFSPLAIDLHHSPVQVVPCLSWRCSKSVQLDVTEVLINTRELPCSYAEWV